MIENTHKHNFAGNVDKQDTITKIHLYEESFAHKVCIVVGIKFPSDVLVGMVILRSNNTPLGKFLYIDGVNYLLPLL